MGIPRRTHLECYADALKALEREKAKSERLRAALEEIKLLDEWHTKADAKDIARKALEQSDE